MRRLVLATVLLLASPAGASEILVGRDAPTVQAAIDGALPGDTIVLPPGTWDGPVVVDRAITLTSRGGVLDGRDRGTVVRIDAPGARLEFLKVRGSGVDRGGPDSCVWIGPGATDVVVSDSEITDCTFGIWVHATEGARIERNHVVGRTDIPQRSNRGNGIHLFDATDVHVVANRVEGARDGIYVSATEDSFIIDNDVSDLRYGIHYMYSWRNTIQGNRASGNITGIALMGSQHLIVTDNVARDNGKVGIMFRDIQTTRIEGNVVEHNAEGLFFFSTLDNEILGNRIAHNGMGARVWAGSERNVLAGNAFVGNQQQVYYVASSDQEWGTPARGNYWSDYLGWDQDGDGRGDRPHRLDSFRSGLLHRFPAAALLLNSPALELLTRVQERMPGLRTPAVFERHPATAPEEGL